jgi:di/tricarboxylate transporter
MAFYAIEGLSIVFKSVIILAFLLVFFSIFPYFNSEGINLLPPQVILGGFSNTSLITVISLLILGQAVVQTRVLDNYISNLINFFPNNPKIVIFLSLLFVLVLSAFINNTPVVIIFIPILQGIIRDTDNSLSKFLMPLSFVAILGGMTTLIGSSTNLLVSDSLQTYANIKLNFFEFSLPGMIIAFFGFLFLILFSSFFLKDRSPIANELIDNSKNNFISQISINEDSKLIGQTTKDGKFLGLEKIKILMIQRGEHAEHGPFDGLVIEKGDILVISSTREQLIEVLNKNIAIISYDSKNSSDEDKKDKIISEAMVTPSSSLIGNTVENVSFRYRYNCIVIGLQRRSKIITKNFGELPLEPGDTLLIQGSKDALKNLRTKSDLLPLEWATSEIFDKELANKSLLVFLGVISIGALEILPLVVSALLGVASIMFFKVLSLRQILRSVDNGLLLLIVTSLALGKIIQETGTAQFLSELLLDLLQDSSNMTVIMSFYIFVSITTNFISNNACAVLFTPIAIDIADKLNLDPKVMAIALIFAVNTSFLTPLAYQTNLLVMGPGHYKFIDYVKLGLPLSFICWIVFYLSFPIIFNI